MIESRHQQQHHHHHHHQQQQQQQQEEATRSNNNNPNNPNSHKKKKKDNKNTNDKNNNKTRATRTRRTRRPTTATRKTTTRRKDMKQEAEEEQHQPQQPHQQEEEAWISATTSTTRATTQSKHRNLQTLVPLKNNQERQALLESLLRPRLHALEVEARCYSWHPWWKANFALIYSLFLFVMMQFMRVCLNSTWRQQVDLQMRLWRKLRRCSVTREIPSGSRFNIQWCHWNGMESHSRSKFCRIIEWWVEQESHLLPDYGKQLPRLHRFFRDWSVNIKRLDAASSTACGTLLHGKGPKKQIEIWKSGFANALQIKLDKPVTLWMLIRHPIQQAKDGATAAADALRRISEACEQGMDWDGSRMDLLLFFVTWT